MSETVEHSEKKLGRRKVLELLGVASAIALSGGHVNPEQPTRVKKDTNYESIEQHGGVEGRRSMSVAKRNIEAIHAASAASTDNIVYIPEGTWYIGDDERSRLIYAGADENAGVAGIGFKGDGPTQSTLKITPEMNFEEAGFNGGEMFRYRKDISHGDVLMEDIALDGNESNVNHGERSRQWGMHIQGSGDFTFENVNFRNHQGNVIRGSPSGGYSLDFDHCSFYNVGVGRINQIGNSGHCIACSIDDNHTMSVTNCEARLISGVFIDLKSSTAGPVTVDNCYVAGASDALFKINNAGTVDISSVYFEGRTQELEKALDDETEHGKWFIYRLDGDSDVTPTIILNDIEAYNMPHSALEVRSGYSLDIVGGKDGPLAFQTVSSRRAAAVRDDSSSGSSFTFDVGEISVHDVSGDVFNTPNSTGTIERLRWNEANRLGETGNINMNTNVQNSRAFQPEVPSRDDVGISRLVETLF